MSRDEEYELYALHFNGRVPAIRYYRSRAKGVAARKRYHKMGYHVQLNKVIKEELYAEAELRRSEDASRSDKSFLARAADRFRRRTRKEN